jgi:hypothetical protein
VAQGVLLIVRRAWAGGASTTPTLLHLKVRMVPAEEPERKTVYVAIRTPAPQPERNSTT